MVYTCTELRPTFHADEGALRSWREVFGLLTSIGAVRPCRMDEGGVETMLDVTRLREWQGEVL